MGIYIFLAVLNGVFISTGRVVNGRLGISKGALVSSYWNHLVGFLFLSLLFLVMIDDFSATASAPFYTCLGGVIGVFFVTINSYVLPYIGNMKTTILVISGQMMAGLLIELQDGQFSNLPMKLMGVVLIIAGVDLSKTPANQKRKEKIPEAQTNQ